MSTPIETNTEELQNILQTVNNLPNAGGGFSIPVIDLSDYGFEAIEPDGNFNFKTIDEPMPAELADKFNCGIVKINFVMNHPDCGNVDTTYFCTTSVFNCEPPELFAYAGTAFCVQVFASGNEYVIGVKLYLDY